jgi:hypothetical protein
VKGQFNQMLVLRHCGGALPFGTHLKRIVLDEPNQTTEDDVDVHSMAVGALRLAMQDAKLDVPIERRNCSRACACEEYWGEDEERVMQMFDPKP